MADPKHRLSHPAPAPADYERPEFEIEGAREPATPHDSDLSTGSLAVESDDSHDPYARSREADRQRVPAGSTTRTDLRKLSAWIKLMRSLEEAKKHKDED
jgi:hypothetical protein